jgi:hypothetical protein
VTLKGAQLDGDSGSDDPPGQQRHAGFAKEGRREHLAAYYRLAADRYALEEEAEAQMAALLNTLEELKRIDVTPAWMRRSSWVGSVRSALAQSAAR